MFKGVCFILGTLIFASVACAQAAEKECDKTTMLEKNLSELEAVASSAEACPEPTRMDFLILCKDVYEKKPSSDESELAFKYQEAMWRMSCAKDGVDDLEAARKKIQTMWNKNKKSFSCDYPGMSVPKGNITKFSLEANFPDFLITAAKDYKLDMNFKDPQDNKTILDYVKDQIAQMKKAPVDMTPKVQEYERLYQMLQDNGAKHSKDL
jgi:hypothetical protein